MTQYDTLPTINSNTVLTPTEMNTFSSNLDYLKSPRQVGDVYLGGHAALISFTSTSYIDLHSDLNLSFHTSGEPVLVTWMVNMYIPTTPAAGLIYLDLNIDGARIGDATLGLWNFKRRGSSSLLNGGVNLTFNLCHRMLTNLSAGLHTIKPQAALSAAGTASFIDVYFWARPL
jgi:hypothetical protein